MKYKYLFVSLGILFFTYIFFSLKSNRKNIDNGFEENLDESSSLTILKKKKNQKSLFAEDSNFLEFPLITEPDFSNKGDLTEAEIEERKKFIIQKAKPLADLFPNNSVIPRELSPTQEKIKKESEKKVTIIRNKLLQDIETSKAERHFYYTSRLKITEDRLEIFKYTIGKMNSGEFSTEKLEPLLKERFEDMLKTEKAYREEIEKNL